MLPNLERAYIFIEIHPHFSGDVEASLERIERTLDIDYQFINYGKTPAVISGVNIEFHHWNVLPRIHYIDEPLPSEIVLRTNEIYPDPFILVPTDLSARIAGTTGIAPERHLYFQGKMELTEPLDAEAVRSIHEGRSFLWFYGHVVYSDVFGKPHETRFCWYYNGLAKTFQQYNRGDEGLNRRT